MTHQVALKQKTIEANSRFFKSPDEVPQYALTMGIKAIMQAKKILLVANGPKKADVLEKALFGPVTPEVPASILQLHPDVTVVADSEALRVIHEKHPSGK
jgi:glucosamine-6-phosphate deaminase